MGVYSGFELVYKVLGRIVIRVAVHVASVGLVELLEQEEGPVGAASGACMAQEQDHNAMAQWVGGLTQEGWGYSSGSLG